MMLDSAVLCPECGNTYRNRRAFESHLPGCAHHPNHPHNIVKSESDIKIEAVDNKKFNMSMSSDGGSPRKDFSIHGLLSSSEAAAKAAAVSASNARISAASITVPTINHPPKIITKVEKKEEVEDDIMIISENIKPVSSGQQHRHRKRHRDKHQHSQQQQHPHQQHHASSAYSAGMSSAASPYYSNTNTSTSTLAGYPIPSSNSVQYLSTIPTPAGVPGVLPSPYSNTLVQYAGYQYGLQPSILQQFGAPTLVQPVGVGSYIALPQQNLAVQQQGGAIALPQPSLAMQQPGMTAVQGLQPILQQSPLTQTIFYNNMQYSVRTHQVQQPGAVQQGQQIISGHHQVLQHHQGHQLPPGHHMAPGPTIQLGAHQQIIQQPTAVYQTQPPQQPPTSTIQQTTTSRQQSVGPVNNVIPAAPLRQKSKDDNRSDQAPPRKVARVQPTPHIVRPIPTKPKVQSPVASRMLAPPSASALPPPRGIAPASSSPSFIKPKVSQDPMKALTTLSQNPSPSTQTVDTVLNLSIPKQEPVEDVDSKANIIEPEILNVDTDDDVKDVIVYDEPVMKEEKLDNVDVGVDEIIDLDLLPDPCTNKKIK